MRLVATVLVAALITLSSAVAHATSCGVPTPVFGERYSDVIFEATSRRDVTTNVAKLQVHAVYKGTVPSKVEALYGGMKGYGRFDTGSRYLVFGIIDDGRVFVHLCGATHKLPPTGIFAEGPWKGWSVTDAYGEGKAPGASLIAAPKPTASASAPAPPETAPTTQPTPSTEEPATPTGDSAAPDVEVLPPPEPQPANGCAGCATSSARPSLVAPWLCLLLATFAWRRRR